MKRKFCNECGERLSLRVGFIEAKVSIPGDSELARAHEYVREVDVNLCFACAPSQLESIARRRVAA